MKIIQEPYKSPAKDDVIQFTINCKPSDLLYLATIKGHKYTSRDEFCEEDPNFAQNVANLWTELGMNNPPSEFASAAARVKECADNESTLSKYGEITLLLNYDRVINDIVIVNGDFKNIARYLADDGTSPLNISTSQKRHDLASELNELAIRTTKRHPGTDRLRGSYFEARIKRGITFDDVDSVFVGI